MSAQALGKSKAFNLLNSEDVNNTLIAIKKLGIKVIKFSRISEHGFDFPANFFLILTLYYFIKIFETNIYEKLLNQ